MNAFILMLATIGAAVWTAWAIRMDRADADSATVADAAEDEWLGL
jgi:hypothetical protein